MAGPRGLPCILMYHRVARPPFDPWGLCVSPANFRAQMEWLKAERRVMPVDDLVTALEAGEVPRFAAAVTFDDGYADNALVARPVLEELEIPATFFLTSKAIGQGPFWWDELAALVLLHSQAVHFEVEIGSSTTTVRWGAQHAPPADLPEWRAEQGGNDARRSAYLHLWELLQHCDAGERSQAMRGLRERLGRRQDAGSDAGELPMSESMVRSLASPLISPGGHGQTHVPLTSLSPGRQIAEIAGGRADIAAMTGGGAPTGFAYPHGFHDAAVRTRVRDAGYRWAVVTDDAAVNPRRFDRYALPRIGVGDWPAETLCRKLR
ncbi:polysaccharide deacetylase family protein [Allopontixanthobacter sp.]|uniref:polysaccharide deacetylase family protein n=1 Tax=Allopontixanthobacter sp. TaxID=2906452 RepID=UPI002ABB9979|nr:polysaccharide deacetylase family protein [Allopontixanthobacter sp.]MDZ4307475.1 polysaccharide deacetylase family protein [Allopontixanthobacter sp.]